MFSLLRLHHLLIVLVPLSIISTIYLYSYPLFHGCAFTSPEESTWPSFLETLGWHVRGRPDGAPPGPPFRLLALGDPQLEGDSSLVGLQSSMLGWPGTYLRHLRKRLDLIGNDYYLAHIYRTMHWWTEPTHVTVLGDLLGSQWVTDAEFERRASRFWKRVFRGAHRVEQEFMEGEHKEVLGHNRRWGRRVINIAGNHDVGYAGDMVSPRVERFEDAFGKVNWMVTFQLGAGDFTEGDTASTDPRPELRIMVLNSMNLDGPAIDEDLARETYDFINGVILASRPVEDQSVATVLLTHIPLPKRAGVCVDGPYVAYNDEHYGGGIQEQNHLTEDSGKSVLESIFGMSGSLEAPNKGLGRPGIILTGHDHEGCDVYHHISTLPTGQHSEKPRWNATRWPDAAEIARDKTTPGIREITVRSMMGDFGGTAGLLSAWYDAGGGRWRFEYSSCSLGVQHIWWIVHVVDLITLLGVFAHILSSLIRFSFNVSSQPHPPRKVPSKPVPQQGCEKEHQSTSTALEGDSLSRLERRDVGGRR